jgi:hypothetical protein
VRQSNIAPYTIFFSSKEIRTAAGRSADAGLNTLGRKRDPMQISGLECYQIRQEDAGNSAPAIYLKVHFHEIFCFELVWSKEPIWAPD